MREPEGGAELVVTEGDELKVVYPQGVEPNEYSNARFHALLHSADGWTGAEPVGSGDSVLPGQSGLAAESADAQDHWDSLSL